MRLTYGVIFVCEWNTCRSAMAKYIFRDLLKKAGLSEKIFVDSAGCITEGNEPIGKRTRLTLQEQNIPLDDEHTSKPFTIKKYNAFDCIIALEIKFDYSRILTEKISALPILDSEANTLKLIGKFMRVVKIY